MHPPHLLQHNEPVTSRGLIVRTHEYDSSIRKPNESEVPFGGIEDGDNEFMHIGPIIHGELLSVFLLLAFGIVWVVTLRNDHCWTTSCRKNRNTLHTELLDFACPARSLIGREVYELVVGFYKELLA